MCIRDRYLDKAKSLKTRLILELKAHKTPEQETRAVEGIVKMIKYKGRELSLIHIFTRLGIRLLYHIGKTLFGTTLRCV